jgi:hypothetical protein
MTAFASRLVTVFAAGLPCLLAANTAAWIPAHRFAVDYGLVTGGSLASLAALDGDRLVVSRYQVPNLSVAPVTFRIQSNLPFVPTAFTFLVTAQATRRGPYVLLLDLFDWAQSRYEPFSLTQVPLEVTAVTLPCPAPPPIHRFVRSSDRLVVGRIRVRATAPVALFSWSVEFDRAGFDALR